MSICGLLPVMQMIKSQQYDTQPPYILLNPNPMVPTGVQQQLLNCATYPANPTCLNYGPGQPSYFPAPLTPANPVAPPMPGLPAVATTSPSTKNSVTMPMPVTPYNSGVQLNIYNQQGTVAIYGIEPTSHLPKRT